MIFNELLSDEYIPLQQRIEEKKKKIKNLIKRIKNYDDSKYCEKFNIKSKSLIDTYMYLKKKNKIFFSEEEHREKQLNEGLVSTKAEFKSAKERASGDFLFEPIKTSWRIPKRFLKQTQLKQKEIRKKFNIEVVGKNVPPLIMNFRHMKFPEGIIEALKGDGIKQPTPIQMQALPCVLAGRDVIGIAYTGSGKTLVFALPMIMFCYEEELRLKYQFGEGPFGLIICPARELAIQTYSKINYICQYLQQHGGSGLRTLLCIGGINFQEQSSILRKGLHMVVATPGRLKSCLDQNKFNLDLLKYLCLDEADRLMDVGFDDDIRHVMSFQQGYVQKVFFSATMPRNVRVLAEKSMIKPIIINVGRAGAANLDVIQEVEYVKDEAKLTYLLQCLKKTPPPVLIFCSNQGDVDDVLEYLLIKGVDTRAIHGGKEQNDRIKAVRDFKTGNIDVLVATDVASKGLDFPDIRHVINYEMPHEIEDYIHRIGRTGRCGKTGVATTFINISIPETTLLDLKGLLIEAKQEIPPVLFSLGGNVFNTQECSHCGGLGHIVLKCPKLRNIGKTKIMGIVDDQFLLNAD